MSIILLLEISSLSPYFNLSFSFFASHQFRLLLSLLLPYNLCFYQSLIVLLSLSLRRFYFFLYSLRLYAIFVSFTLTTLSLSLSLSLSPTRTHTHTHTPELMNTPELSAGEVSTHFLMQDYCTAETQAGAAATDFSFPYL